MPQALGGGEDGTMTYPQSFYADLFDSFLDSVSQVKPIPPRGEKLQEIAATIQRDDAALADRLISSVRQPYQDTLRQYKTCIEEAKKRIGNAPIKEKLTDISAYDTVFIMSPIYWGTYAPEVETALEGLDFQNKTVRIISTHEGSGLASMPSDVKKMCKGANVDMKGLAIKGSQAKNSKQKLAEWL